MDYNLDPYDFNGAMPIQIDLRSVVSF